MAIGFSNIPATLLVPGFYVEFDASRAGLGGQVQRALILAQRVTVAPLALTYITTADDARSRFGAGSQAARMVEAYRRNDPFGELWVLPVADAGSSTAATGTIAVSGTSTAAGTISLYIAGQLVQAAVPSGTAAAAVATGIRDAINAVTTLPVTATTSSTTTTLTAKNAGTLGNDIDIRVNYLGSRGGQATPAGITLTITAMASGATDPVLTGVDAILNDEPFDYIVAPAATTGVLDAFQTIMSDATGRWSWTRQVYGHVFAAKRDTSANLLTLGAARNDPHASIIGINDTPTPGDEIAAAVAAVSAVSVRADPARPLQTLAVQGVLAPPVGSRFSIGTNNSLLGSGIARLSADPDGTMRIQRIVTTYQRNGAGVLDRSMLDVETMFTLMEVTRRLRNNLAQKFARSKLADDGTRFGPGQPVVTPAIIKSELVAHYATMERDGLVENADAFASGTIVERDGNDPNRVNVLYTPDLVNQLRVMAILNQFRV